MAERDAQNWMLSEALTLMARAEEMRRLTFGLASNASGTGWWPPLDLIETETEVIAFVTLPGVELSSLEVTLEPGTLVLRGRRSPPPELRTAAILRLELPRGPFERRVGIPEGRYRITRQAQHGYLIVRLTKSIEKRGR